MDDKEVLGLSLFPQRKLKNIVGRYVKGTSPFDITVTSGRLRWHRNQSHTCAPCKRSSKSSRHKTKNHQPNKRKFYICADGPHTHPLAHKHFYTQTLLHTDRNFYTQTLLHTDTFTQKPFDTQKLRHTDPIYTQTLLHTNAYTLTLTPFYIQHELNRNFTSVFAHRASFRAKGLLRHK